MRWRKPDLGVISPIPGPEGRAQVLDEWWTENAVLNNPADKDSKKEPRTRQIPLPEGTYESVPYHNRSYEYIVKP